MIRPDGYVRQVLLLLCCTAALAVAQQPPPGKPAVDRPIDYDGLTVEAVIGIGDFQDQRLPIPVSLMIHNDSGKPIEADLVIVPNTDFKMAKTLAHLELPTQTHKRFSYVRNLQGNAFLLQLRDGRDIFWQRRINVQNAMPALPAIQRAIVVDRQKRKLQLGLPGQRFNSVTGTEIPTAAQRRIASNPVPEWQLPDHPGAIEFADAIVFSLDVEAPGISRLQLDAVGRYVAGGGLVFVPAELSEFVDRLLKALPLPTAAAQPNGPLTIHRSGGGAVVVYSGDLYRNAEARDAVASLITKEGSPTTHPAMFLNRNFFFRGTSEKSAKSEQTVFILAGFFVIYAVLVGPLLLVLFKLKKRKLVTFVGGTVAAFTAGAVFLGTYVTNGDGDLLWMSYTELTETGGVQKAILCGKSAGGRRHKLAVDCNHPDIQLLPRRRNYYYWNYNYNNGSSFFPYDVLREREYDDTSAAIDLKLNPWSQREVLVTGYGGTIQPLDVSVSNFRLKGLRTASPRSNNQGLSYRTPRGTVTLRVKNPNPFPIKQARLVLAVAAPSATANQKTKSNSATYTIIDLGSIASQSQFTRQVNVDFATLRADVMQGSARNQLMYQGDNSTTWSAPRLPNVRTAENLSGIIVGRIEDSPAINVNFDKTSFSELQSIHIIYQRLDEDQLPKTSEIFKK